MFPRTWVQTCIVHQVRSSLKFVPYKDRKPVAADWEQITPFLAFPADLRRVVYTTNSIEALNRQIRKIIKTRGHFPTEDAARKLIYLAITNAEKKWKQSYNWNSALAAFKIHFGDRLPNTAI